MFKIYIDGGSRGNPGESAVGFIIMDDTGKELFRYGKKIGYKTNNCAEYIALVEVLKYLKRYRHLFSKKESITIYSDSILLVNQINGYYKVKSKNIIPLYFDVQKLLNKRGNINIKFLNREKNKTADWIVNRVLNGKSYRPVDRSQKVIPSEESPGS